MWLKLLRRIFMAFKCMQSMKTIKMILKCIKCTIQEARKDNTKHRSDERTN